MDFSKVKLLIKKVFWPCQLVSRSMLHELAWRNPCRMCYIAKAERFHSFGFSRAAEIHPRSSSEITNVCQNFLLGGGWLRDVGFGPVIGRSDHKRVTQAPTGSADRAGGFQQISTGAAPASS
jgi:hypothetical protein